ncbi:MAG: aminotransferase class IV [Actinomycetota bacterium]|nr:aminotransferase class IV [Actinomycetota bacterium]
MADPKANPDLLIYADGRLVPRADAVVSVFDAGFQSGDAVWEGLRVYNGHVFRLADHLQRLRDSSDVLKIELTGDAAQLTAAIYNTLEANGFVNDVHIRLMVTRGTRATSGMDPRNAPPVGTLFIVPEVKPVEPEPQPVRLQTSKIRRPSADTLDPGIHHANQLNSILARLDAYKSAADAALMLDQVGFVAEADTANIFSARGRVIETPTPRACLHGITRGLIIELGRWLGYKVIERDLSVSDLYASDEVFLTGTICELVPVTEIDQQTIGTGKPGATWDRLLAAYRDLVQQETLKSDTFRESL